MNRPSSALRSGAPAVAALVVTALGGLPTATAAQEMPPGWQMRADRPGMDMAEVSFVEMPPGWHVTTGPAVILWHPEMQARGDYRVEAEIFLFDPGERREAFGFFVGGTDLDGPEQAYTYVLLRNGGQFLIKEREGAETRTVLGWTDDEAVRAFADRGEGESSVRNVVALERQGERVRVWVNGTEVAEVAAGDLPLDGTVGLRVNHALDLHVSRLEVTPSGGMPAP